MIQFLILFMTLKTLSNIIIFFNGSKKSIRMLKVRKLVIY